MGISIGLGIIYFLAPSILGGHIRQSSNLFGALGVAAGISAVSIWIARKIYIEVKKRKLPDFELTKAALMFLRKHHVMLGWLTILVATAHGVYYMLHYPNQLGEITTGILAWTILAALVFLGILLDYRLNAKMKSKSIRAYHFILASIFILVMVIHA